MTDDIGMFVRNLRRRGCAGCIYFKGDMCKHLKNNSHCEGNTEHKAADLIESLYREKARAEDKLSKLLSHVTGGRFSKPTYSIAEMKIFIEDYQQNECDVCDDVAQLVRERDAALHDLRNKQLGCDGCKYFLPPSGGRCALPAEERKHSFLCWEWRGPCAENGGTEHE